MGFAKLASLFIKPVTDLVDNLHTSEEEKAKINFAVREMLQNYDKMLVETKGKIIEAEAKSEHILTATWRPITALVFVAIVANNYIIAPYMGAFMGKSVVLEIPPEMWELLKIMIGGYVVSRGAEKGLQVWKGDR